MSKFLVIIGKPESVDFYKNFSAKAIKKKVPCSYVYELANSDTERPSKSKIKKISADSGLSEKLIGDISHYLGEFVCSTQIDEYGSSYDFVVHLFSDEIERSKLIFIDLICDDMKLCCFELNEENLKRLYVLIGDFFADKATFREVYKIINGRWS